MLGYIQDTNTYTMIASIQLKSLKPMSFHCRDSALQPCLLNGSHLISIYSTQRWKCKESKT